MDQFVARWSLRPSLPVWGFAEIGGTQHRRRKVSQRLFRVLVEQGDTRSKVQQVILSSWLRLLDGRAWPAEGSSSRLELVLTRMRSPPAATPEAFQFFLPLTAELGFQCIAISIL